MHLYVRNNSKKFIFLANHRKIVGGNRIKLYIGRHGSIFFDIRSGAHRNGSFSRGIRVEFHKDHRKYPQAMKLFTELHTYLKSEDRRPAVYLVDPFFDDIVSLMDREHDFFNHFRDSCVRNFVNKLNWRSLPQTFFTSLSYTPRSFWVGIGRSMDEGDPHELGIQWRFDGSRISFRTQYGGVSKIFESMEIEGKPSSSVNTICENWLKDYKEKKIKRGTVVPDVEFCRFWLLFLTHVIDTSEYVPQNHYHIFYSAFLKPYRSVITQFK